MKKLIIAAVILSCSGCGSLGVTPEDAGNSAIVSNATVPANGSVVFTIERNPRTDPEAQQYYKQMGITRSIGSWFGLGNAGQAKTQISK